MRTVRRVVETVEVRIEAIDVDVGPNNRLRRPAAAHHIRPRHSEHRAQKCRDRPKAVLRPATEATGGVRIKNIVAAPDSQALTAASDN